MQQLQAFLNEKKFGSKFILCDENTGRHCLPILKPFIADATVIQISSGEQNKNLNTLQQIWFALMQNGANRNSVLINLGGGVITDIGALAAATYMRGISFIHVPTTLLAMTDACVGGKSAIDFEEIKNLIGVFANPNAIVIHQPFIETLAPALIEAGMAEVVKHALINSELDCLNLMNIETKTFIESDERILESMMMKYRIVEADFTEKNIRKKLNLGHTVAHAIETVALMNKQPVLHGHAVATGLVIESSLSFSKGMLAEKDFILVKSLVAKHSRTLSLKNFLPKDLLEAMKHDKKNFNGEICFSVLKKPGEVLTDVSYPTNEIVKAIESYNEN